MANAYKLYSICKTCDGTGIAKNKDNQGGTMVCPDCNGAKVLLIGYCSESVTDIPALD